jgi:hypothetical protein
VPPGSHYTLFGRIPCQVPPCQIGFSSPGTPLFLQIVVFFAWVELDSQTHVLKFAAATRRRAVEYHRTREHATTCLLVVLATFPRVEDHLGTDLAPPSSLPILGLRISRQAAS